jgi:acetyl-CoA acetyltransferase
MCAPIGDGAAAAILVSGDRAARYTTKPVWIKGSALVSGSDHPSEDGGTGKRAAEMALRMAGMTIDDINVMEVHDASAPAELLLYEDLGLCKAGEGGRLMTTAPPRSADASPSTPAEASSPRATRSAPQASPRPTRSGSTCRARPETARCRALAPA